MTTTTDKIVFWQGEVQLLGWSETNTRGRTITLQLGEDETAHPFKHSQTKQGKTPGKRYMAVFVELDDNELPVEKTPSQVAFLQCKEPTFWRWADDRSFQQINDEDTARSYILEVCGIKSRSELDTNEEARMTWEAEIRHPYDEYVRSLYKPALSKS